MNTFLESKDKNGLSDAAIEAADMVIMNDSVSKLSTAIRISSKTIGIVKQNIIFAIGIKIVVLLLAAAGFATARAARPAPGPAPAGGSAADQRSLHCARTGRWSAPAAASRTVAGVVRAHLRSARPGATPATGRRGA